MSRMSPFRIRPLLVVFFLTLGIQFSAGSTAARGDEPAQPLSVSEISPGVFVAFGAIEIFSPRNRGHIANIGFIVGKESVAVIDTGGSLKTGKALLAAVRKQTDLPVRHVINTHMHPDHVLGNAAFAAEGVTFWGHGKLTSALQRRSEQYLQANAQLIGKAAFDGTRIVYPNRSVEDSAQIDLGDRILDLEAFPTAHTDNDVTVTDRMTKTVWLGDLLFVRHIPALDGSITGWLAAMEQLSKIDAKQVVPGHGPADSSWPKTLEPQRRYLQGLADEIRKHLQNGTPLSQAAKSTGLSQRDAWALFEEFNARNVAAAYTELEWE